MAPASDQPKVLWQPAKPKESYMWYFIQKVNQQRQLNIKTYEELRQYSIGSHRDHFWEDLLLNHPIIFDGQYSKVVDLNARIDSVPKWFEGLNINWAENMLYTAAVDSHSVRTKKNKEDDKVALIEVNESSKSVHEFTYGKLRSRVAFISSAMRKRGVKAGDRIAAIMNSTIDTLCICLSAVCLGAIFTTSSTDLGSKGILERLRQIEPVYIFFADSYEYNGKEFIMKDKIKQVLEGMSNVNGFRGMVSVARNTNQPVDLPRVSNFESLESFLRDGEPKSSEPEITRVPFAAPFVIVYSSGTTGSPKCIAHSGGGVVLSAWKEIHLHRNVGAVHRVQQFTNTSWIMYLASINPLMHGASSLLYDGSPFFPKVDSFLQLTGKYKVTHLGVSPRFFSTIQSAGIVPKQIPGLDTLEGCTSTGMVLPTSLLRWYYSEKGFPSHSQLANISGGTDVAGAFVEGNPLDPIYDVGGCQCISLGNDVRVFDSSIEAEENTTPVGKEVSEGQPGDLVCVKSFPNMPPLLFGDSDGSKYKSAYFSRFDNVWTQGDFLYIEPQTKATILLGRADGVLNPSGIRFGSAEIYTVIEATFKKEIEDTVCVGQRRKGDQDENVLLFVKMNQGYRFNSDIVGRIRVAIADGLSRRHVPRFVFETKAIPTTINLKKVELPIKRIVSGEKVKPSGTLANPESLDFYYQFVESEKVAEEQGLNKLKSKL